MNELNIKSSTIEKGLDLLKEFLEKVIGPTANELGQQFGDGLKIRRLKNQLKNFEKIKKIVEEHNVQIKQIDLKALFPYLQNVSLEEDETLQDIWANLFVNYIDSSRNLISTVYPSILSQLSTNEVKLIQFLYTTGNTLIVKSYSRIPNFDISIEEISNLHRLGLINATPNLTIHDWFDGGQKIDELVPEEYYISNFGLAFIEACTR